MATYSERYVCFVDILGFSDAITNPGHPIFARGPAYFDDALTLMGNVMSSPDLLLSSPEINQFSDNIVLSCPVSPTNIHMVLYKVMSLQQHLLKGGLATRGAITKGNHYRNGNCLFGPALVQAAHMEKNEACVPRVILSSNVKADVDMSMSASLVGHDPDFSYVEYIENWGGLNNEPELHTLKSIILLGLSDPNIRHKYQWLTEKYNKLVDALILRFPGLTKI